MERDYQNKPWNNQDKYPNSNQNTQRSTLGIGYPSANQTSRVKRVANNWQANQRQQPQYKSRYKDNSSGGGGTGGQSKQYNSSNARTNESEVAKKTRLASNFRKNGHSRGNFRKEYFSPISHYDYELISIKRIVKVVKGGRRFRFSVIVVVGDYKTHIGYGVGKANEIPVAIIKARANAEKKIITVNINPKTKSIWFDVDGKYNASKVFLKNARLGTGIIAGGSARQLLSFSGIKNIYLKSHGSRQKLNLIRATIVALQKNYTKGWLRQDYANDVH